MSEHIGLYLHIPFCKSKCAYCDFFSRAADEAQLNRYTAQMLKAVTDWGKKARETVSSVYFGGGTPSVLGTNRLCELLCAVKSAFTVDKNAEITLEVNPESALRLDFSALRSAGFNRVSVGLQSANDEELKILGRIHTPRQAAQAVKAAQAAGIENTSLDLMMGIPLQTRDSLRRSIDFCASLGVTHISSYILKIEQGTRFYSIKEQLQLPDDDAQAELYLFAAEYLKQNGFLQYEISNFSVPGFESRHNTLYWRCGEYIGIGAAAHSFYHGRRFYTPRSFEAFYRGESIDDGEGGGEDEYIMLALRLAEGLRFEAFEKRFGHPLSPAFFNKLSGFEKAGYMKSDDRRACFTPKGFLVSNAILSELLI